MLRGKEEMRLQTAREKVQVFFCSSN